LADAIKITRLLLKKYPNPTISLNFSNPLELLVATILSAQCTDTRVNAVTQNIFKKYRSAGDYGNAKPAVFEKEIRSTGFYKNKARMIIQCCKKVVKDFSSRIPGTIEELTTLPGVGRKTANVVLGSAFGKQAVAVDTHVLRVSHRLGIARSKNPDKVEGELVQVLPPDKLTACNLALILHGRETCTARNPGCPKCVLYKECEWEDKNV
jgi:endonuclease-3